VTSIATMAAGAEPLRPEDLPRLTKLLEAERLPSGDLCEPGVRLFAFRDGGAAIVDATLAEAQKLGATRAFLLTTAAKAYFERLGIVSIDRASAPDAILSTRQAAGLCPSSAPLMVKTLA
jgi:hypothetical protein